MGGSQSREELEKTRAQLSATERRATELQAEAQDLKAQVEAQAAQLKVQLDSLDAAGRLHAQQLAEREIALREATRQKKLAEDRRVNDALLAKRLMHAQMCHPDYSAASGAASVHEASGVALASQDMQFRHILMRTLGDLEAAQAKALRQTQTELSRELWLPELCDVSMTLRSTHGMMLAGLRMPRTQSSSRRGLSPGVAVLRHIGEPTAKGPWAAVGGAVLWDSREREVSAMRLAMCAQPSTNQLLALSFDHTGSLTGRYASPSALELPDPALRCLRRILPRCVAARAFAVFGRHAMRSQRGCSAHSTSIVGTAAELDSS